MYADGNDTSRLPVNFVPKEDDIRYSRQLQSWWFKLHGRQKQVADHTIVYSSSHGRKHCLVQELTQGDLNKFVDFTVEVIPLIFLCSFPLTRLSYRFSPHQRKQEDSWYTSPITLRTLKAQSPLQNLSQEDQRNFQKPFWLSRWNMDDALNSLNDVWRLGKFGDLVIRG